jgi:hypothetical protein
LCSRHNGHSVVFSSGRMAVTSGRCDINLRLTKGNQNGLRRICR